MKEEDCLSSALRDWINKSESFVAEQRDGLRIRQLDAALAHWLELISSAKGVEILSDNGLVLPAAAMARLCAEHLFALGAILKDPNVAALMLGSSKEEFNKALNALKADTSSLELLSDEVKEELRNKSAISDPEKKSLKSSQFELAQKAGLQSIYNTRYRLLSMVASHATALSIGEQEQHVVMLHKVAIPSTIEFLQEAMVQVADALQTNQ
ncbi:DUF5677 domain-containing protein [Lysobacter enzymogenes]|uniref:DUF5677 domain-containing protein n=1 Tax=Lysobacter enzymogenes TaxID=69 RepID=UPI0011138701|nr:DUF5677 domain-containing protein [Lysobacter enzymogenes]